MTFFKFLLLFGVCLTAFCVVMPNAAAYTDIDPAYGKFENLGQPIRNIINLDSEVGVENGRAVEYIVIKGANNSTTFVVADILSGRVLQKIPLPGVTGAWAIRQAGDGNVYLGTHSPAAVYQYRPGNDAVKNLGTLGGETHVFSMAAGPDGKVFIGTYPNAHVFEYDPATGQTRDLGRVSPEERYTRSLAYDSDRNVLYAGVGGARAGLVRIDLASGEKREILHSLLPDAPARYDFTYHMEYALGKLFVKLMPDLLIIDTATDSVEYYDPSKKIGMGGSRVTTLPTDNKRIFFGAETLYAYDIETRTITPAGRAMSFQSARFLQLNEPEWPGITFVATGQKGLNVLYNLETEKQLRVRILDDGAPVLLQSLSGGFDQNVYIGGYLGSSGFLSYDPNTNTFSPVRQFGQTESVMRVGDKIYMANYPGAKIWEFDPAKAWAAGNPRQVAELGSNGQDRPFAMAADEAGGKLFIGSVPDYGSHSGALSIYNVADGSLEVFRDIVQNQGIVALLQKDGLIYGGTTVDGGLGTTGPVEKSGKFFIFDTKTKTKVFEMTPNLNGRVVSGLLDGPDGLIWGVAEELIFKFDPQTRRIVYQEAHLSRRSAGTIWADAAMEIGRDGNVYGTDKNGKFFRIAPQTMEFVTIKEQAGRYLTRDRNGDLYMSNNSYLWKFTPATTR